ncbi:MAG: amidohydrolase family protein [Sphingobacteriaceae bacterium]|nr:amidohydrolase family protein [Sphingobacteriaceae bacterium]
MKKILFLLFVWSGFALTAFAQPHFPFNGVQDERPTAWLLTNANIVTQPGQLLESGMMLIRDGKVVEIAKTIAQPADAQLLDLQGKYIYPAFVEPYGDYGISKSKNERNRGGGPQFTPARGGAYTANDAIRADQQAASLFQVDAKAAEKLRKSGYGAVATHLQDGIARGTGALVATGDGSDNQQLLVPQLSAHFSFNKGSSTQDYPSSLMGSIALLRQTYYDARWYQANKSLLQLQDLSLDALLATATLPQIFESAQKYDLLRIQKLGAEFGLNYVVKGRGDEYQYLDAVKAAKTPLLVPVNFPDAFDVEDPLDARDVSLAQMLHWELAPGNLAALHKAGVPFAVTSSDLKNPADLLPNMRLAIEYGLPEAAALEALTLAPARLLKADKLVGQLVKGGLANFIVCSEPIFNADNEMYQTWVLGKKYEHQAFPEKGEMRGTYVFKGGALDGDTLVIKGKASAPEASIRVNDSTTVKFKWELQGDFVNAWVRDAKLKDGQLLRFSLWRKGTGFQGSFSPQEGQLTPVELLQVATHSEKVKEKPAKTAVALGVMRYPFADLGHLSVPKAENILIKGATVWTSDAAGVLEKADVAVKDGKIVAVGANIGAAIFGKAGSVREIDGSNMHLTPGLIDEHSHIAITRGVNEGTRSITSEVRIGDVLNPDDVNIYRQLAGGVTSSNLLHGSANSIGGQAQFIKLRWGVTHPEELKFKEAPGYIKFALGENVKQSNWGDRNTSRFPQTRMGVEQVMHDGFLRARDYEAALKANPTATRRDLSLDALVEIMKQQRFITCHSYVQSEINMLMKAGDSLGFKVNTFTHILEGYKVADKMLAHGSNASTFADWWAYKYEVIDAIPHNAAIMNRVGVNVVINSDDAEMARRLNQEAAKTVKYGGMSEEEALKMVTINPAKALRADAFTGSIKVGKQADLVLWNAHPLSMYSKPVLTLVDGVAYFDASREAAQREALEKERQRLIEKMLDAKKAGKKTSKPVMMVAPEWHCETLGDMGEAAHMH